MQIENEESTMRPASASEASEAITME